MLAVEELLSEVAAGLCRWQKAASFAKCVRERMRAGAVPVFERDVWMVFAKSGTIKRGSSSSSDYYDRALSAIRASSGKEYVERVQRAFVSSEMRP